jgi:hypothetical protein
VTASAARFQLAKDQAKEREKLQEMILMNLKILYNSNLTRSHLEEK